MRLQDRHDDAYEEEARARRQRVDEERLAHEAESLRDWGGMRIHDIDEGDIFDELNPEERLKSRATS
jgi:hypothetical protein